MLLVRLLEGFVRALRCLGVMKFPISVPHQCSQCAPRVVMSESSSGSRQCIALLAVLHVLLDKSHPFLQVVFVPIEAHI
jgi:hypothetical protein